MNKLQIKGSWNELKGKLKQQYGNLSPMMIWCFRKVKKMNCLDGFKRSSERVRTKVRQMIEKL
ncbi:MAG TPA: hypothetical protein VN857_11030 [Chthoniobacterales bacterium]|nr:hypothetical protein [Chthoniobacterales bacterium]